MVRNVRRKISKRTIKFGTKGCSYDSDRFHLLEANKKKQKERNLKNVKTTIMALSLAAVAPSTPKKEALDGTYEVPPTKGVE